MYKTISWGEDELISRPAVSMPKIVQKCRNRAERVGNARELALSGQNEETIGLHNLRSIFEIIGRKFL